MHDRLDQHRSSFPRYILSLCVFLNLLTLVFISWRQSENGRRLSRAHQVHEESLTLRGEILRIDEVLTMSCWVAATTGNAYWIRRYHDHVPVLDAKIEALLELTPGGGSTYVQETNKANQELVQLELKSLELAKQNDSLAAVALLESERYLSLKTQYREGMDRFERLISAAFGARIQNARAEIDWGERLTLFFLAFLLVCWFVTLWVIRSWRRLTERFHQTAANAEHRLQGLLKQRTRALAARTLEAERQGSQIEHLLHALLRAEQQERVRLGRLMHDELQQLLVSARMRAAISRDQSRFSKADLVEVIERLDEAIESARDLTTRLHPLDNEQKDFTEMLKTLSKQMNQRYRLTTHFEQEGQLPQLRVEVLLLVYGIVRELLFNVVKHAQSSAAKITVQCTQDLFRLVVQDEGVGFDVQILEEQDQGSGLGLIGMRERLAVVDGSLDVVSQNQQGTMIMIEVPNAYARGKDVAEAQSRDQEAVAVAGEVEKPISLFIADDNEPLRRSLLELFNHDARFKVIGEAGSGPEAVSRVLASGPDLVLMDFSMPGFDGAEATRRLKVEREDLIVIAFSSFDHEEIIQKMYSAGALKVLQKDQEPEQLLNQLYALARAGTPALV